MMYCISFGWDMFFSMSATAKPGQAWCASGSLCARSLSSEQEERGKKLENLGLFVTCIVCLGYIYIFGLLFRSLFSSLVWFSLGDFLMVLPCFSRDFGVVWMIFWPAMPLALRRKGFREGLLLVWEARSKNREQARKRGQRWSKSFAWFSLLLFLV